MTATTGSVIASMDITTELPASTVDTTGLPNPPVVAVEAILVMLVNP